MSQAATESGQESGGQGSGGQAQEATATGTEGQAPEGQQTQDTGNGGPEGIDLSTIQDPAIKAYLEKVQKDAQEARQEAARYRTERNDARTKVTEYERQNETEQQRAEREEQERQERIQALERENRDLKVGSLIRDAAKAAFNPDLVVQMLGPKVEFDSDGKAKNVADLVKDLKRTDPYLFKRENAGAGEGGGDEGPSGSMNDRIRAQITARRGG